MTMTAPNPVRLIQLIDELARMDRADDRWDRLFLAAIEEGGTILTPDMGGDWPATHMYEIDVLGIQAFAASRDRALRDWCRMAIAAARRHQCGLSRQVLSIHQRRLEREVTQ